MSEAAQPLQAIGALTEFDPIAAELATLRDRLRERIDRERREADAEAAKAQAAEDQRKARQEHRAKVHREALASLMGAIDIDEKAARMVLDAIRRGDVRHVTMEY